MTGVYKILHLPTNSVYIGQTSRPFQVRWNEHRERLNDGSHKNWKLRDLWNISDIEDFQFQEISAIPKIFSPLKAQILRALEEVYEIKQHKNSGHQVLNITDGETVKTKKAWNEFIENYEEIEFNRIQRTKRRHSDRTSRRRDLESLKKELLKLRWQLNRGYENRIAEIEKVLNRKSLFYRVFGLIPDVNKRQLLLNEIKEAEQNIRDRNDSLNPLREALAAHNYSLSISPTSWEAFELYMKVKRNAYYLRNRPGELKERAVPSDEIPLDLMCPTQAEIKDAFDYLESFSTDSMFRAHDSHINLDKVQDSIIILFKSAIFEKSQGYLGLSIIYKEGLFVNQDVERSKSFFSKAVQSSLDDRTLDEYWKHELISLHEKMLGSSMDIPTKIVLLKELADRGYEFAQFDLGELYQEGVVVSKDLMAAFDLFEKASSKIHPFAMYELGLMYYDGEPIPVDLEKAFKWISEAAKRQVSDAAFTLGWMYESGSGCEIDLVKAYTWYLVYSDSNIDEDLLRVASALSPSEMESAKKSASCIFD